MAKEISSFDLERLARTYNIRIWQCRKIGRRWSFIAGAGEEKVLPSHLILEHEETGIFIQSEHGDNHALLEELKLLILPTATC